MSDFKVGDKVVYVGNNIGKLQTRSKLGLSGEVISCGLHALQFHSHIGVVLADPWNVRLCEPVVVSAEDKAIALLTEAGYKVEAPKWEAKRLEGVLTMMDSSAMWNGFIRQDKVEFGQYMAMTFANVEALYQGVQEAKAFSNKNKKSTS